MMTMMSLFPAEGAVYSREVYSFLVDSAVVAAPLEVVLPAVAVSADLVAAVPLVVVEPVAAGKATIT